MSKTIEDKAQEFAEINEDNKCNYSFSYNKYDIANAFQNGAEFGYALAENRIKKEYEWKLRWIPVEEKLPEIDSDYPNFSVEVHVKNTEQSHVTAYYFFNEKRWCFDNNSIDKVTHWRYFL